MVSICFPACAPGTYRNEDLSAVLRQKIESLIGDETPCHQAIEAFRD